MAKKIVISILGLILGISLAYLIVLHPSLSFLSPSKTTLFTSGVGTEKERAREVIGFLPYWLAAKAESDYSPYITQLAYFALTVDTDGSILKLTSPVEAEPGWYALNSGKMDQFLKTAKSHDIDRSLTVF